MPAERRTAGAAPRTSRWALTWVTPKPPSWGRKLREPRLLASLGIPELIHGLCVVASPPPWTRATSATGAPQGTSINYLIMLEGVGEIMTDIGRKARGQR